MWNKLSQAAALVTGEIDDDKNSSKDEISDDPEKLQHQELLVQQLKDLVRENEKRFQEKAKEYDDLASKFDKFKLQSKAKIAHLSKQVKDQDKISKKEDCDFDDASSTDSERSQRGKILLLKKQLDQAKQQTEKKEEELKTVVGAYERKVKDLELLLNEKNAMITSLTETNISAQEKAADISPSKESNLQEMYAQIVYKDSKIMDLNNQILELEKKIMDLQENINEKDEVLQQRNRAVQLMAEDLNRKGQTTVIELDETRDQMKLMQQNFASIESDWKVISEKYQQKINELENVLKEVDSKLKHSETMTRNLEAARYELSVRNAELQQKIVHVQESASKQCEQFNKEVQEEIEIVKKALESKKKHNAELQKTLDEFNTECQSKIMKARVEERKKAKKLERELAEAKKISKDQPEEVQNLQQKVVELEEEKGSLQLRLIEIEDQINQIEKLKEDNATLGKTVEEAFNKISLFENQVSELQSENENWKINFSNLKSDYDSVKDRFEILSKEHFEAQEAMTALLEEKKYFENNYDELQQKLIAVESERFEIMQNLQQTKDEKVAYELKNIEQEEMRDKEEEIKNKLISRIEELEKLVNDKSRPFIQLEKENSELKEKIQILNKNKNELHAENSVLEQKLFDSENERIILEKNNSELKLKLCDLENDQNELKNNYEVKSNQTELLMKELENKDLYFAAETKRLLEEIAELDEAQQALQKVTEDLRIKTKELEDSKIEEQRVKENMLEIMNIFKVEHFKDLTNIKTEYDDIAASKNIILSDLIEKNNLIQLQISTIHDLKSHINSLTEERDSHEKVNIELRNNILDKDKLISEITSELESRESAEKILMETLREKEESLIKQCDNQHTLKQRLKEVESIINLEHAKTDDKVKTLLDQLSDLENELTTLREELSSEKENAKKLNNQVIKLSDKNKLLTEKLENTSKILNEKNSNIHELELIIENKCSEIQNMVQKIEHLKIKNIELTELKGKLDEKDSIISLKEKCIFETNELIEMLKLENDQLKNCIKDQEEKLESSHVEYSDTNSKLLEQKILNSDLMRDLSIAQEELSSFKHLSSDLQSQITEKEVSFQNAVEEKSSLQNKVQELHSVINQLNNDIEITSASIENYKKKCEELSAQVDSVTNDVSMYKNTKQGIDAMILNHKLKLTNLTDENKLLRSNIISLQESYSVELSKLSEEIATRIQKAEAEMAVMETEKSELTKKCNSLHALLKDNDLLIETQKIEIHSITEERKQLEKLVSDYQKQIESSEGKIKVIENELSLSRMKLTGEKSEMELMLQNIMNENKKLIDMQAEFHAELVQCNEEIASIQKLKNNLECLIAEKDGIIQDFNSNLTSKDERILNLQDIISSNNEKKDSKIQELERKLLYFETCKLTYCSFIKSINSLLHENFDFSFLENDNFKNYPVETFSQLSQEISNSSLKCLVKIQDNVKHLVNNLNELENENLSLKASYVSIEKCLTDMVSVIKCNMNLNNSKFDALLSVLNAKSDALSDIDSKLDLFKSSYQVNVKKKELYVELDKYKLKEKQLNDKIISLETQIKNSDHTIQAIINEKSVLESNLEQTTLKLITMENDKSSFKLSDKEKEADILKHKNHVRALEEILELQSVVDNLQNISKNKSIEKEALADKLNSLDKKHLNLKREISKIGEYFCTHVSEDFNLFSVESSLLEEDIAVMLSKICSALSLGSISNKKIETLYAQIDTLELENKKLTEDLKMFSNENTVNVSDDSTKIVEELKQKNETELCQQLSSFVSEENLKSLEQQTRSLQEEVNEYKKKFAKALSKLKSFKDEKEKINKKLQETLDTKIKFEESCAKYLEKIDSLQEKVLFEESEKEKYLTKIQSMCELNKQEINALNSHIAEMKERHLKLENEYVHVQHELQEYKQTWEQTNVSYELQKEDNECLKAKIKNQKEVLDSYNSQITALKLQMTETVNENIYLKQESQNLREQLDHCNSTIATLNLQINEVLSDNTRLKQESQNLREHANMLISDNDNFQNCMETLTAAKNSLEKKLVDLKEKFDANFKKMQIDHELELKKLNNDQISSKESELCIEKLESECASLRTLCTNLQLRVETLQLECETHQKNLNLLEKEKTYFQHQLSEKSSDLQKIKTELHDTLNKNNSSSSFTKEQSEVLETSKVNVNELLEENIQMKQHLNKLIEEVNFAKEMNAFLQQEYSSKESSYNEKIVQLEKQLHFFESSSSQYVDEKSNVKHLENELHLAMNSLHNQGLRSEELSLEVSKLLEERNVLNWKVQQYMQMNPGVTLDQNNFNTSSQEFQSVKVLFFYSSFDKFFF